MHFTASPSWRMRATALLAGFCLLVQPCTAAAIGQALETRYAQELEREFLAAARADPSLNSVLFEALVRARKATFHEFLPIVRSCQLPEGQAARVQDDNQQRVIYLTRELSEPVAATEPDLRTLYAVRVRAALPSAVDPSSFVWTFEPDVVLVKINDDRREICLQPGKPPAEMIEYLGHELVHFARAATVAESLDPLGFKDSKAYVSAAILARGEEVDAYQFEYGLRVRRRGKPAFASQRFIDRQFSERGEFTGTRQAFAAYVLDELHYRKMRFEPQYKKLLQESIAIAEQKLNLETELLGSRALQEDEYHRFLKSRFHAVGRIWRTYGRETARVQGLLEAAKRSRARLQDDVPALATRLKALRARLDSV